nr:MAG TPA: hypothetical protein [Caudoviricetes sp.]
MNWRNHYKDEEIEKLLEMGGDDTDVVMDYVAGRNPDGWLCGYPDTIIYHDVLYIIRPDDRPGLRDYFAVKGIATDGHVEFFRLFYLFTGKMDEAGIPGICVAWKAEA